MWLIFNKMADDLPSEPRTNQTVVSLLDHLRPPAPHGLSRTLPVLKCSALVFLEAGGHCKLIRLTLCEIVLVLLYAVQEYNFLKFTEICVAILDDRLYCCVFTVIFMT